MPKTQTKKTLKFPKGFLWGAATSAYQVEGGIDRNDWANSKMPPAGLACDHYHRFEEDFLLAKKLNQNAHRLSLEWSRIEPQKDEWSDEAIHHYLAVLRFLKQRGFKTFLTLYHFTNPVWFTRKGGWASKSALDEFAHYVSKVAYILGDYVDFWLTINEPNIYANLAYLQGVWPPFGQSLFQASRVFHNLLEAHNRAYEIIHAYYPSAQVGFAQNITFYEPARRMSLFDQLAVKFLKFLSYEFPYHHTKNDFLGVNHYFHNRLKFVLKPGSHFGEIVKRGELSERGWEIYPQALFEVLIALKKFRKPIYITENGLADTKDSKRASFIARYLQALHRAIHRGVEVRGYLHWSLLDCFEWEDGYKWKFGLIKVDFERGLKRRIRKSAKVYAEICKNNMLKL